MNTEFYFSGLVKPFGIAAFVSISIALTLGLLIKRNRKRFLPWHMRIAVLTFIIVILHGIIALLFH